MNPYETLGVARDAGPEEIRKAFRRLASELHPDRCVTYADASERMACVNIAYELLADAGRRALYDRTGLLREPPALDAKAQQVLASLFNQFIDQAPEEALFASTLQVAIRTTIQNLEGARASHERVLRRVAFMAGNLKDPDSLFAGILVQRRDNAERGLEAIAEQRAVADRALEMLRNVEAPAEREVQQGGYGSPFIYSPAGG